MLKIRKWQELLVLPHTFLKVLTFLQLKYILQSCSSKNCKPLSKNTKPRPPPNHHSPTRPEVNLFSSAVNDTSKKRASPIAGSAPARSLSVLKLISHSKASSPVV